MEDGVCPAQVPEKVRSACPPQLPESPGWEKTP